MVFTILFSSCQKDSDDSDTQPIKPLEDGQLYANGIIAAFGVIADEYQNTSKPNYVILVVSLKEYDNLTYAESIEKVKTLKDEFGEWNFFNWGESRPGVRLDDFLAKNNATVFSKNKNFWVNDGITGKTSEMVFWSIRNDGITTSSTTTNKTLNYSIRPVRIVTQYNSPLKSVKVGNSYGLRSIVFSVDAVNKKFKIFTVHNTRSSSWDLQKQWMNEVVYDDGKYGFRLPTVEEMKEIQKARPTFNFHSIWTSDLDAQNGNKPFVYSTNANPQVSSNWSVGSSTVGVKEISY